jgi:hypothetical protein
VKRKMEETNKELDEKVGELKALKEEFKKAETPEAKEGLLKKIERMEERLNDMTTAWKFFIEKSKAEEEDKKARHEAHVKQEDESKAKKEKKPFSYVKD